MRILLAAGGTGGHVFPAEALAEVILHEGHEAIFITDKRSAKYGGKLATLETYVIPSATLSGSPINKLLGVYTLLKGFISAWYRLLIVKPDVVVGFGGYPSLLPLFAASHLGIPTIIHEQNSLLGRVNAFLAQKATIIATSFEQTERIPASLADKIHFTGNPVREAIGALRERPYPSTEGKIHLLITGGSQGATVFSTVVPEAIARLPEHLRTRLRISQQCRAEDIEQAKELYRSTGIEPELATFFSDMPERLASTHLLIGRSGASTLAELTLAGRPAILVPYPAAKDDHQTTNAKQLADKGGAWVMPQPEFTPQALAQKLEALLTDPTQLENAAHIAKETGKPQAAYALFETVLSLR